MKIVAALVPKRSLPLPEQPLMKSAIVASAALLIGAQCAAEPLAADATAIEYQEISVKILAPWEGKGEVHQIGPETLMFLGTYEGIMYIETGDVEQPLDAAIFTCPATAEIRQFEDQVDVNGHCAMTSSKGDLAFARFNCKGGSETCIGRFVLTGGTGALEGIAGEGDLVTRTALSSMVENAEAGTLTSSTEGLAVWPELRVRLPLRNQATDAAD
jgi:hypothetical protein